MRQEDFAADVAHELRTPLAVLSLEFDRLDHDDSARLKHDVDAMRRLIDQLLLLAQTDAASAAQFPLASVSLVDIARALVRLLAPGLLSDGETTTPDARSGRTVAR